MKKNLFFNFNELKYLGKNLKIGKLVNIRNPEKVIVGDNSIIDDFTYISGKVEIGNFSHIAPNNTLTSGKSKITIGNCVGISNNCAIHASSSEYLSVSLDYPSIPEKYKFGGVSDDIILENFVLLGSGTLVLPGVKFPNGSASAAKTILRNKKYNEWTLYSGYTSEKISNRKKSKILNSKIKNFFRKFK